MSAEIISQVGNELTLQIKIDLSGSMLEQEEKILMGCNALGLLSTEKALERFDTDGSPILIGGTKYTSRGQDNKEYQTPYGVIRIKRHVYQDSSGGKIYVPLEMTGRIIHSATPRFSKMLSHKYSSMSAEDVLEDFSGNHGRVLSKKYVQQVSKCVSDIAQAKIDIWEYALPKMEESVATIMISMDGAMLPTCTEGWRESMVGTISLYNGQGERQHTIYVGEVPEYGKSKFMNRFSHEVLKIKGYYPHALTIGIADGARNNWPFLKTHTQKQLLDFYHVTEYLAEACYAAYPEKTGKPDRIKWLNERCHQLKHDKGAPQAILNELRKFKRKKKLSCEIRENLKAAITYFKNNLHRMNYAEHVEDNLPIGSGVTEAACKTLIKQRFCRSGMRWKEAGIQIVLRLRELVQTTDRWRQFWDKIDQYGVPCLA
jgi:hypothetical protein